MSAVFKGTTAKCLMHLRDAIRKQEDPSASRKILADFVGVQEATAQRWFSGEMLPAGEMLVRLRFYLEYLGYEVVELNKLSSSIRNSARLVAFRVVEVDDVLKHVGYATGQTGRDQLSRIYRGEANTSDDKLLKFQEIESLYGMYLQEAQAQTRKIELGTSTPQKPSRNESSSVTSFPVESNGRKTTSTTLEGVAKSVDEETREQIIVALANGIRALYPLAVMLESDAFSEDDRAQVRELSGGHGVFRLANSLYRICGERSRAMRSPGQ